MTKTAQRGAAIEIAGLRVRRGARVVIDGVDLVIPRGQTIGLLGPSGSGKTTLMRAIVGMQSGQSGHITVLGEPAGARALRSQVGYVTQVPSVYSDLSVRDNLAYFAAVLSAPTSRIGAAIDHVGLADVASQRVENLSGGQRSRVSLAAALLGEPELLVLDEPTVGLDPVLRRELWELFARLAAHGTTILISSHVMDEATRCDRLVLLREGRVLADDSLPDLLARTGTTDAESAFLTLVGEDEA